MEFVVDLPVPPSVNRRLGPRRFKSKALREWERDAAILVRAACRGMFRDPVEVSIRVNTRQDVDNFLKSTLDALHNGAAIYDDRLVHRLVVERDKGIECGWQRIAVRTIG